jgi:hypothetical protein
MVTPALPDNNLIIRLNDASMDPGQQIAGKVD